MAGLGATGLLAACGESSPGETAAAPATTPEVTGETTSSTTREAKTSDAAKAAGVAASTGIGTDGDAGELLLSLIHI